MKSLATLLNKTPWWVLLPGGIAVFAALVLFVTPFQLIQLESAGATPEENRAIKREIEFAFSEGAVDVVRGVVKEMRSRARDPELRAELDAALSDIEEARAKLRDASREAQQAKRDAARTVKEAVRDASRAVAEAQKQTERALKDAGPEGERIRQSLEESLEAARQAEREAKKAAEAAESSAVAPPASPEALPETTQAAPESPKPPPKLRMRVEKGSADRPIFQFDLPPAAKDLPPLPPEMRADIRRKVSRDLYQIGVGAGLILIFIPLFILAIVAKFFIDRSRAAQREAEQEHREAQLQRMGRQVTEAKLAALQAQVEPHFLYNTLASVQALTEVDPKQANAMTGHLIQYLRNALPKMRESASTVGQEIELVRAYLNILQMRMGKRLAFEIVLPPELADAPFPPLMLPSLVENAVRHGLEPLREGGRVTITVEAVDGRIRIAVADTGKGFAETVGAGVGLANIRERLAALYGAQAKLTLESNPPQGVVAVLEVPRQAPAAARPAPAAGAPAQVPASPPPASPSEPSKGVAAKTLSYMGSAERAWRKGLSFAFVALVIVAAVLAGLALVGVGTGLLPMHLGDDVVAGPMGTLIGTAVIGIAFIVVVLAIAIVLALIYGLGFVLVSIAIFVAFAVLVSLIPALAPLILVGLAVWWLVRRSKRKAAEAPPAP